MSESLAIAEAAMIPLTTEETWLDFLTAVPVWEPPAQPMVVIAPHPDDETLGTGGLIARQRSRGIEVGVVCVTDGEAAYQDMPALAATRIGEQKGALGILSVPDSSIARLHLPDSRLSSYEDQLFEGLEKLIPPGALIVAPWTLDRHPDHEACGRAAERIAQKRRQDLIWYLFWTWHQSMPKVLESVKLGKFELNVELLAKKLAALNQHQTQLHQEHDEAVLPERFLAPAHRMFEIYILPS